MGNGYHQLPRFSMGAAAESQNGKGSGLSESWVASEEPSAQQARGTGCFCDRMTSLSWGLRVACAVAVDTGEGLWQAWKQSWLGFLDA